jgi:hypothetical protein
MIEVNSRRMLPLQACIVIVVALSGPVLLHAAESPSGLSPAALHEIAQAEAEIDLIEAQTLARTMKRSTENGALPAGFLSSHGQPWSIEIRTFEKPDRRLRPG